MVCESPRDAFELMIDETMLGLTLHYTNQKLESFKLKSKEALDSRYDEITMSELKCFIRVQIVIGLSGHQHHSYSTLWSTTDPLIPLIYRSAISRERIKIINRFLRFDDLHSRELRKETDKLAPIREYLDYLNMKFNKYYVPLAFCCIDEQLIPFRGRCPFRVYIKNKPDKFGIKNWLIVDCESRYIKQFQIYLGKVNNQTEKNQSQRVVLDLAKFVQPGSHLTFDNFFTSIPLAEKLLESKITCLGTLRANKAEVPPEFLKNTKRVKESTLFGFHDKLTLASYAPDKNKAIILLSTLHHDKAISSDRGKPVMILDYNHYKTAVDSTDQRIKYNTVRRSTRRWSHRCFQNSIDHSLLNARIIYNKVNGTNLNQYEFNKMISLDYIKEHINQRNLKNLPIVIKEYVKSTFGIEQQIQLTEPSSKKQRKGCSKCTSYKGTTLVCVKCNQYSCNIHSTKICLSCLN